MTSSVLVIPILILLWAFVAAQRTSTCGPGTFLDSSKCKRCPAGTYQPFRNSTSCIPCPPGTFNLFKGAQGVDLCEPCQPDTFNPSPGAASFSRCKPCPSGTASVSGSARCVRCPPGRFVALPGRNPEDYSRGYSLFCSPHRNTGVPPARCYAGDYPRRTVCAKCNGDFFTTTHNARSCERCPFQFLANENNSGCRGCSRPGVSCKNLPHGVTDRPCTFFSFNNGSTATCEGCPPGMIGNTEIGATFCVPCPPKTYKPLDRGACMPCADTVVGDRTRCEKVGNVGAPCPPNFFRHAEGYCAQCGQIERLNKEKMMCEDCDLDSVSTVGIAESCVPCPPNSSRMPNSLCRCKPGSFPVSGNPLRCDLCPAGTFSIGQRCLPCPSGFYAPKRGLAECLRCPFNLLPDSTMSRCSRCPRGMVPNVIRGCVSALTNCPAGQKRVVDRNAVITDCEE